MKLTPKEESMLLHLTGSDSKYKEPLWRNYANLNLNDPNMKSMEEKGLVKSMAVTGYAANGIWQATEIGKELAKTIFWRKFGPELVKNLRNKLMSANQVLWNEGHKHFPEFKD